MKRAFFLLVLLMVTSPLQAAERYETVIPPVSTQLGQNSLNSYFSRLDTYYADNKPTIGFNDASGYKHDFQLGFTLDLVDDITRVSFTATIGPEPAEWDGSASLSYPDTIQPSFETVGTNITFNFELLVSTPLNTNVSIGPSFSTEEPLDRIEFQLSSSIYFGNGTVVRSLLLSFELDSFQYPTIEGPGARFITFPSLSLVALLLLVPLCKSLTNTWD